VLLKSLISAIPASELADPVVGLDTEVAGLCDDSRQVSSGDLFLALPGSRVNGARFVEQALEAGAVAVLADRSLPAQPRLLRCDNTAHNAGLLADAFYGRPSSELALVGITGTNGKTSCAWLLESIWRAAGIEAGIMGTLDARCSTFARPARLTTPGCVELQATLADFRAAACEAVAMEVSSHALEQQRVSGCRFDTAVFTNLTRDHLDYHADEQAYFDAKALLFTEHLAGDSVAVINHDDPWGRRLLGRLGSSTEAWTWSTVQGEKACITLRQLELGLDGIRAVVDLRGRRLGIRSCLLGAVNVSNMMAAIAVASSMGIDDGCIVRGLADCAPVPGRMERVGQGSPVVLVDYAHTPDALERTLRTLKSQAEGRLLVVFGCGGDRDKGKRAMMGEVAGRLADVAVLTSDNPRTEDPETILDDIEQGTLSSMSLLKHATGSGYLREADRGAAIRSAIGMASPADVVVVAGKGHEDYQETDGVRAPFDDRLVVAEVLDDARPGSGTRATAQAGE
jgi:UDP-N-acetylmuramoyl-L-alanyl-D-glutamate--2,6-diaminopimelate ligase